MAIIKYSDYIKEEKEKNTSQELNIPKYSDYYKSKPIESNSNKNGNILNDTGYVLKKASSGLAGSTMNIVTKPLTETANELQKGSKKSLSQNALGLLKSMIQNANPISAIEGLVGNATSKAISNFKDKDSNTLQKVVNTALDVASPEGTPQKAIQLMGSILPGNASDKVLKAKELISSPVNNFREKIQEEDLEHGKVARTIGSVAENVGQMVPSIITTAVTGNPNAGLGIMGISASEGATNEALKKGADLEKAVKIGNIKGETEILTEMMTGGVNIFGKGSLDNLVEKGIIEKVKNKVGKWLLDKGYEVGGEILEELVSDVAGTIIDKGTVDPNAKYSFDDFKETAIVTSLSTIVLNALTGGLAGSVNKINNNKIGINNQNNIIKEENIQTNANTNIKENSINNDTIINKLQTNQNNAYSFNQSDNTKINNFRQSVVDNQLNNSNETKNFVDTVEKVIKDKNYNIVLDSTITNELGNSVNAKIETNANGEVEIRLNPNSERAGEFLLVHEISHAIKSQEMIDLINNFAARNEGFRDAVKTIENAYGKDLTNEEVFADVCGQLFGNQEFINSLQMENTVQSRSLIKQIYEQIKYLLNKLTNEGRYRNFIQDLESKWRVAYQTQENNLNGEANYMMIGTKGATNSVISDYSNQFVIDNLNEAKRKYESGKYTNEDIRQQTMWFKDDNGDWLIEIPDNEADFKITIRPNQTYKLGDIFNHSGLYEAYPELQNITIKTKHINPINGMAVGGYYDTFTKQIVLNNSYLNSEGSRNTLLHEIQHKIQKIEGIENGSSSKNAIRYYTNLGEIMSKEVENRSRMNLNELKSNAPEISKKNPIHPDIKRINDNINSKYSKEMLNNKQVAKLYNEIYNNGIEGDYNRAKLAKRGNIKNILSQGIFSRGRQRMDINNQSQNFQGKETQELDNSSFSLKQNQLDIIKKSNPAPDEYHTWVRSVDDILTFKEAFFEEGEYSGMDPDFTEEMAEESLKTGKVTVYSSYPIENGTFVSPSKMEASQYAAGDANKLYSKEVNINDVAWIDGAEGQYAKLDTKYSQSNNEWYDYLDKNYKASGTRTYFEDIKSNDNNILKATSKRVRTDLDKLKTLKIEDEAFGLDESNSKTYKDLLLKYDKDYVIENETQSKGKKAVSNAVKEGKNYLDLSRKESVKFKEQLSKYVNYTQNQLKNNDVLKDIKNIVSEYSNRKLVTTDDNLKQVQSEIRKTNIKVSDYLKKQITDYGFFRKANFGKLRLGNQGIPVDTFYQELCSRHPEYFDSSVINDSDMLNVLADFMNKEVGKTQNITLSNEEINMFANSIYEKLSEGLLTDNEIKTIESKIEERINKKTRADVREELIEEMGITESDLDFGKDISAIDMFRTDPVRLNEKVFGYEVGQKINEATINKTKHNEAERIRFLNKERSEIAELGIKPRSKESAALQKLADGEENYSLADLAIEFPDVQTQEKIKRAAKVLRNKYDNYIDQINESLVDMGYEPIRKRKDYMRHFQALDDVFSKFGTPLNKESMSQDSLPTDINGITDQFKPGKSWFANALQRKGIKTSYDAITGIDGYLEGASNLIYHTEDIQRYRALSSLIRDTYGQQKGLENIDKLSNEKAQERMNKVFNNNLSKYAAWLDEQANALANKKGKIDRGLEEAFGRKIYNALNTAKKQVGSNMTGFNVRSALTNFASAIQGASKTNKLSFIKGTLSTIQNIIHNDGLINKSDFLTSRFGSNQLSSKLWQRASNAGQIFMTGTDYFTANQIWRSKYFENLSKGMNETQAIKKADDFAARIMGDRSKGATASIFNSKTMGLLTQFQLEVNNQWSSIIHDNKMDIKSGNKTAGAVVFQLGQLAAMSYLFNNLMKALTGSDVMIDPIDLLKKIFAPDDDDKDKTMEQRATEALGDLVNDIPFVSVFTGGRIPVGEAFKGAETSLKKLTGQKDKYGNEIKGSDVKDDLIESAFYWLLPTGYGQLKKTGSGLSMYNSSLPIAGSYTKSGNLRFNADESTTGKVKAALFGQYSSEESQKYRNSGYKTINKSRIGEMKDLGMSASEYRKYREGLNNAGSTNQAKIDYVNDLEDVTKSQKNIMSKNILNRTDFDINEYNKYDSYDEYNYAYHNPEKYDMIDKFGIKYSDYKEYQDKIKTYSGKDKKQQVWNYIENLHISKAQKIMLYKNIGGYSINNYKDYMFNYIDNLKITKNEKQQLWKQLYGEE